MFCGIVGFTGNNYQSAPILLKGLQKLEYRGYDSAGLYVADQADGTDQLVKENGRVSELVKLVSEKTLRELLELPTLVGQPMVVPRLPMLIHTFLPTVAFT